MTVETVTGARETNLVEGVTEALALEMERDERVMVLGADVGVLGGVFRATTTLQERFGDDRCADTPLAEAGIVGAALGLAMSGMRPVCEVQYDAFGYLAFEQLFSHVARYRWRSGGSATLPFVLRLPYGGGIGAPEMHSDSPEAHLVHTPGLKVVVPSTPADAKGLLTAAIRDEDPVVVLEPKSLYRSSRGPLPEGEHLVPLGSARVAIPGGDVSIFSYGAMVPVACAAAGLLAPNGIEAEVIDLRSLKPLDTATILASVRRTGRAVIVHEAPAFAGFGAELAALLAEQAIFDLRAPVARVAPGDVVYPYWSLEDEYLPSAEQVASAAHGLVES